VQEYCSNNHFWGTVNHNSIFQIFFYCYYIPTTCFSPYKPSSGGIYWLIPKELFLLQQDATLKNKSAYDKFYKEKVIFRLNKRIFILGFCILLHYIKVIRRTILRNNVSRCLFYILQLHVLALVGNLHAEYTSILGSYFTHNSTIVFCY
jgi:hypothetical protein